MKIKLVFIIIVGCFLFQPFANDNIGLEIDYHGFLDNREYFNSVQIPKTIFGSRISPAIRFKIDSTQNIYTGFNFLTEFGSKLFGDNLVPIIYYKYYRPKMTFLFGLFPRKDVLEYPLVFLSDSLDYYRPNIEGMHLSFGKIHWNQNIWIDWTGRQTDYQKETFLCGFYGNVIIKRIFIEDYFLYYHRAFPIIRKPNENIRDNGGGMVKLGIDLNNKLLDTLSLSCSAVGSFDKVRNITDFSTPIGMLIEFYAEKWKFGINGCFYKGNAQILLFGDSFYKSEEYGRLDMFFTPIKTKNVTGKIKTALHIIENHIDHSEGFDIVVSIRQPDIFRKK